jgi:hypothetical protein
MSARRFKKRTRWGQAALSHDAWSCLFTWVVEMRRLFPEISCSELVVLSRRRTRLCNDDVEFPRWLGRARLDEKAVAEAFRIMRLDSV